jgi:hypothetical protein
MTKYKWTKRILKWFFGVVISTMLIISLVLYIFKDDIIGFAIKEINHHLKAKVEVNEVDITFWATFPNLSIDFDGVFIQDALPLSKKTDTLLYSDQIRLKFDPMDIWNENYKVKAIDVAPGTVQLKVSKTGNVNYDIFRPSKDQTANEAFDLTLEKVHLEGIRFSYNNQLNEQLYATTFSEASLSGKFTDEQFTLQTDAAFTIHKIQNGLIPVVINQPATTTVTILVDKTHNTISLPNGVINLAGLPFTVNFFMDSSAFRATIEAKSLALEDVANKLALQEVQEVSKFKGSGTANFKLKVASEMTTTAYPSIDCQFAIRNGKLTEPTKGLTLSKINLKGFYSTLNGIGKEELKLNQLSFNTATGPFSGNLSISQFQAPKYKGNAKGSIDLAMIDALFHLPKIQEIQGKVQVDTHFALSTTRLENNSSIQIDEGSGSAQLLQVLIQLDNDTRKFKNVTGKLLLNKQAAALENLCVQLGKSDLRINGIFDHIDGFLQDKSKLEVEVSADSRMVNLSDFTNTYESKSENNAASPTNSQKEWMLPSMIAGQVSLAIGTIQLDDHSFQNIHGNMVVSDRIIAINQLQGTSAQATVSGALTVQETAPEYFELATNLSSNTILFKPLFKEWNNFDQDVITAANISGKAEAILDLKAPFDFESGIIKEKLIAQLQLKVTNGNLKNVSTFKQLTADLKTPKTRMVLKPQEIDALQGKLDNISFATLQNTIYIKNSTIIIPKMEIESSALSISVEGSHTFDNMIDYRFAFRLRALKMQKDESEFGEVADDGTGVKVYVRMYGPLDKPSIVWDQKARKDQAKENREQAKQEAISILKSEFGLFKKDTTIKAYQPKNQPRESIQIQFGKEDNLDPEQLKAEKKRRESKISKFGEKLKKENEKEKGVEFTVE